MIDRIRNMTSGERRKRMAELILKGTLGRQPTPDEIYEFISAGGIAPLTREQSAFFAEVAERHGLTLTAARFRERAAARCTAEEDIWDETD